MRSHSLRTVWMVCLAALLGTVSAGGRQLGSYPAKEWQQRLDRPDRITGLKINEVIPRLGLKADDVVVDIGAGTGVFSLPLARAVGSSGKLLAVEIDQGLLDIIEQRAKEENVSNVQTVLGKLDDPNLPTRQVDLAFFHDVLHHIEHRQTYLKALATYLKPKARIVVIDMIKGPHQNQPEMQIRLDEVKQWMEAVGFSMTEEIKLFDDKFFAIFGRNP